MTHAARPRRSSSGQVVETLSGGNQQKVLLGRVLAASPRLLLLYDATRGVDVGTKAEIFASCASSGRRRRGGRSSTRPTSTELSASAIA